MAPRHPKAARHAAKTLPIPAHRTARHRSNAGRLPPRLRQAHALAVRPRRDRAGCAEIGQRPGIVESGPGDTITVNPGEVHDGMPLDERGRAWRMLYLEPALVAPLAAEVHPGPLGSAFEFHAPTMRDARLAAQVLALFDAATHRPNHSAAALHVEECLLQVLGGLLRPKGHQQSAATITRARTMMDDDPTAPWSLAQLADAASLSRYQLVRQFAQATGLTPHAYLLQRRLQLARHLMGAGTPSPMSPQRVALPTKAT